MIKNIIFDMGNVLTAYREDAVAHHFIEDEAERKEVTEQVFKSKEWLLLDKGVITDEKALERMQARLSTPHAKEMAALCLAHWHEYNMEPNQEMGSVVKNLKERGFGIYLCSNASLRLLECYRQVIPAIDCFDGILFSSQEKCIKPEKEIFERLLEKFALKPSECFFIDDIEENIQGARACGMDGYCFADQDVEKLKNVLEALPSLI